MKIVKLSLLATGCALAVSLIGVSRASAGEYSCAFTGAAGPITPYNTGFPASNNNETGVEAVGNDLLHDEGNSPPGDALRLLDTDNGAASDDGTYSFTTALPNGGASCIAVQMVGAVANGIAGINSTGEYDNTVCGTGIAGDDSSSEVTTIWNSPPYPVGPPDVTDMDYSIEFEAGQGALDINSITFSPPSWTYVDSDTAPEGIVNIVPTMGNCVNTDVSEFQASGAFRVHVIP
jgi:hypothetical protein